MRNHALPVFAPLFAALIAVSPQASAVTQAEAEKIAAAYVATLPADGQESYEATRTVLADLDGDGKAEMVVQVALLGPTYWSYQLEVFADRGKGYRHVGSSELWGDVQDLRVDKGTIVVKSKMPGPNDPRCCPTLDKTYRYRWQGGKVVETK